MSNKFLTPQIVANEALMVLENNLVAADLVHKDYSKEFAHVGDTITIRKPAKFSAKNFVGETVDQNVNEGSVKVTLDHFRDVTVPVTSKEMTLDIKSFSEQIISPAVQAISQAIDSDIIAEGIANASNTVSGTANATDLKDIANIAKAFDLVLNGTELSSGSIRITNYELQQKMFQALGLTDEEIEAKFGFLVEAYRFGAPPHGGMGIGLDRLAMVMLGVDSLRDVTAFPKVQNASELMSACPSAVDKENQDILGIAVTETE